MSKSVIKQQLEPPQRIWNLPGTILLPLDLIFIKLKAQEIKIPRLLFPLHILKIRTILLQ
jgi:hypothetical protein